MNNDEESQENRIRYFAKKEGLVFRKSRRGGMWLVDPYRNAHVFGGDHTTLDEVEEYLKSLSKNLQ